MHQEMLLLLQRICTGHGKAEFGRLSDIVMSGRRTAIKG
jgi:hypothetical protein